jgi:hypothetical protein
MSKTVVDLIRERTGISEQQAEQALDTVVSFLKQKLPAPIAGQLDGLVRSDVSALEGQLDGLMGGLGGMFGKKE